MKVVSLCLLLALSSCYAEWDIPRTPRRDPCTDKVTSSYVYIMPACRTVQVSNPRDLDDQGHVVR